MSTRSKKLKTENELNSNANSNMSSIEHRLLPRSMFDYNMWNRPLVSSLMGAPLTTLDLFDPFDDLDTALCRNMAWIDQPDFLPRVPRVPHKYRIAVNCQGYKPDSIKAEILNGDKLVVTGKEGVDKSDGHSDYSVKEFKRTYTLPSNVESDKMVSFLTGDGKLVIEMPLKVDSPVTALLPAVTEDKEGNKRVTMGFDLPKQMDPAKLKVTCKDRDLIVQAEDKAEKEDGSSQFYFYRRCTLPENTDFDALKCTLENNKLAIEAPINVKFKPHNRSIPIENRPQIKAASANGNH